MGPPQYCSITVYEEATPELLRDFFWDDDFRPKWDDMLLHATTLEEFPNVGASVVHWIRKVTQTSFFHLFHKFCTLFTFCSYFCVSIQFPFFCSDREYTIGRRIWESERSFYCVTKV